MKKCGLSDSDTNDKLKHDAQTQIVCVLQAMYVLYRTQLNTTRQHYSFSWGELASDYLAPNLCFR